ncbi:MAG: hypothetical protein MH321_06095 [Leptospiraceae bacterium]|nr:hypothetical protein [Leptospiraceae bacterium]
MQTIENEVIVNEIRRLAFKLKRSDYTMIYKFMPKARWIINHMKVYRIFLLGGLKIRKKPKKKRKLEGENSLLISEKPNKV